MRIGFFGGCFNPPTNAHINLAKKALKECKLDKVIFMPVGDFYKKKELVSGIHRYNMLKIACKGLENIEVSDLEINTKQNLCAADAFKLIEQNYPETDIYFIMGADNFINIATWKNSDELIRKYKYIVLNRENIELEKYVKNVLKINEDNIVIIENETYRSCSSSNFRSSFREEKEYDKEIISDEVLDYIIENKLFLI